MTTESAQSFRLAQMGKLIHPGSYVLHFMQCQFVNDMVFLWVTLLMCSSVPQSESFHLQEHYGILRLTLMLIGTSWADLKGRECETIHRSHWHFLKKYYYNRYKYFDLIYVSD